MRILFVCENYIPHYGGAEVVFKNLAEGFVKKGHSVALVTRKLPGTKRFEVINGVKVHRVLNGNSRYVFSFSAIKKVLKLAKDADIIQTTTFNGAPPAWIGSLVHKKPVVLTVHEVWQGKWGSVTDLGWFSTKVHDFLESLIYKLSYTKYVCVSDATRKDLLKLGVDKGKAVTIHNGLDYSFWDSSKFDVNVARKNHTGKFIYFASGRPGISKGMEYLIQAAPVIEQKVPGAELWLMMGSRDQYKKRTAYLMDLIEHAKKEHNATIKVIDSIPYEEMGHYLKAADCVVVPSLAEGFGYSAAEACAMGKKLVVTNVGSLPEVVSGTYNFVESKSSQAIAQGVIDIFEGRFVETKLKKFLWDDAIEKYLEVYERLVEE